MMFARVFSFIVGAALLAGPVAAAALTPRAPDGSDKPKGGSDKPKDGSDKPKDTALPPWCEGHMDSDVLLTVVIDSAACVRSRLADKKEYRCGQQTTWTGASCQEGGLGRTFRFFDIFFNGSSNSLEPEYITTCSISGMPATKLPTPILQITYNKANPINTFNFLGFDVRCARASNAPPL